MNLAEHTLCQNIEECFKRINATATHKITWDDVPLTDKETFHLLTHGPHRGMYRLDSPRVAKACREAQVDSLEQLIAVLTLFRPRLLDQLPLYLARRQGLQPIVFAHPTLEPILEKTYGLILYQEQLMATVRVLTGYPFDNALHLCRVLAYGKSRPPQLLTESFVTASFSHSGVSPNKAARILLQLRKIAPWLPCTDDVERQGYLTYVTAYLLKHYPLEYLSVVAPPD